MPKLRRSFIICSLIASLHPAATLACETQYDPTTHVADIPCLSLSGASQQAFAVTLAWAGGNTFTMTGSSELGVGTPYVDSVKIVPTPTPVALIYGNYADGCTTAYGRPTLTQSADTLDITLKTRRPLNAVCTQALVPFVEVVSLPEAVTSQTYRYSVNGVMITPTD